MGKYKGFITSRDSGGRRRTERLTATRDTQPAAASAIKQSLLPDENLVYIAPDDGKDDGAQDVGVFGG